ncbi:PREDICTED: uncharacterized protein LOC107073743, partial [Polistes dominula]|uniref:Uncharacterized protein LOC107073743 n=1 Tax=Polistes dominula TaxID=743375 RepID=A0ABM1JBT6_POLDO
MQSQTENYAVELKFLLLPSITNISPSQPIPPEELVIPANIRLADTGFDKPSKIDAILGMPIFCALWHAGQIVQINDSISLQNSRLGWIAVTTANMHLPRSVKCHTALIGLQEQLEKFWRIEQTPERKIRSQEEEYCEAHYANNTRRDSSGRYIVRLPLRENANQLGDSYVNALKRFHVLERSLARKPGVREEYAKFLSEYEDLGHMERIEEPSRTEGYYLPHHAVTKQSSITTKLRVVFDASAKSSSGLSLNDILMVGPMIQEDLFTILLRFRSHAFALTADIAKMYRQ